MEKSAQYFQMHHHNHKAKRREMMIKNLMDKTIAEGK